MEAAGNRTRAPAAVCRRRARAGAGVRPRPGSQCVPRARAPPRSAWQGAADAGKNPGKDGGTASGAGEAVWRNTIYGIVLETTGGV